MKQTIFALIVAFTLSSCATQTNVGVNSQARKAAKKAQQENIQHFNPHN